MEERGKDKMGNKRWEGFWMWPLIQGFFFFFFFSGRVCVGVYFLILCVRILSFVFSSGDGVSVSVIFLMWDQMMECWGVGKGAFLSLFLFQVLGCVFFIHDPNSQLITLSLSPLPAFHYSSKCWDAWASVWWRLGNAQNPNTILLDFFHFSFPKGHHVW